MTCALVFGLFGFWLLDVKLVAEELKILLESDLTSFPWKPTVLPSSQHLLPCFQGAKLFK